MGRLLAEGRSVTDPVISGLIEKRRQLAGIIDEMQRQLDQHRAEQGLPAINWEEE